MLRLEIRNISLAGDVSNLGGMTSLVDLDLRGRDLKGDVGALAPLTLLTRLTLEGSDTRRSGAVGGDLVFAQGMHRLVSLKITDQNVTGTNLRNLTQLRSIT